MTTLESMQAKIKKLEQQAEALIAKQSSGVVEKIQKLMAEHGLTAADIDGHAGGKQRTKKAASKTVGTRTDAAVKYRDPKSGATWTGHGRAPSWIANTKNRDKFLVDGSAATAKPVSARKVKTAGNNVRGPQPAMYREPKSGATWSGRGRAPAWIAEAKNRDRFLIAGAAEANVATTAGPSSKAKTAAKKASKSVGATAGKGQPKGQQPAMYRDPKSGAKWSGRGRAPAWLASVKGRSKFLIDGTGAAADAGAVSKPKATTKKVVATKATLTKKPAAKKTTANKAVNAKAPAKKAVAKNAVPAAVKKAPRKSVAVPAPVATVESGAELTT
ncbi:H-NS family nucleoid-associated regulatory protein [Paraburkholderia sp. RL17-337-BIB-A]|uniref:H-NS family nucleoid-associated regulatory protein n=1 Tax=Paraburkholderia sp. RL17-337-BIB-A TaxID=3031636 RepID=UPI0038B8DBB6